MPRALARAVMGGIGKVPCSIRGYRHFSDNRVYLLNGLRSRAERQRLQKRVNTVADAPVFVSQLTGRKMKPGRKMKREKLKRIAEYRREILGEEGLSQ